MKNTKFWSFHCFTYDDNGNLTTEQLFQTRDPEVAEQVIAYFKDLSELQAALKHDKRRKQVVVLAVNEPKHACYCAATNLRSGLFRSLPVKVGDIFPSATRAAAHMGCKHNEVAVQLALAKRTTAEKSAAIRGVTFQYVEDRDKLLAAATPVK